MENQNYREQGLIKSVLTSEVKYIIGIVAFVGGVVAPYYGMRQDIAVMKSDISNINSNHEVHDQDILQAIKDLNIQEVAQEAQIIELQKELIVVTGKLQP